MLLRRLSDSAPPLVPDALSEVLQDLRPRGVSYGHCKLKRPWGIEMPAQPTARLHLVAAGEAWLMTANHEPLRLIEGDLVFFPTGHAHSLADSPGRPLRTLDQMATTEIGDRVFSVIEGGNGEETRMACCSVGFDQPAIHPLLKLMPAVMQIRRATVQDPMLPALLEAMADEILGQRIGAATILARLADIVITRLIRTWVETTAADTSGWLAAMRDPRVGRALAAIHREPERPWSVADLAQIAGTSRSLFSERFTAMLSTPPGQYLANWRMDLATSWLSRDRMTVSQVAARLGYESEASFSRAFKRHTGVAPGTLRSRERVGRTVMVSG